MIRCAILLLLNPILMYGLWNFNPNFTSKSYYYSGKILSQIDYRSGIKSGNCTYYFENGNKQSESYYLNGKLKGEYKSYYESGELNESRKYIYDNNNIYCRKNCSWKTYSKDGKLKSEAIIESGITKQWQTYTSNGEISDADIGC